MPDNNTFKAIFDDLLKKTEDLAKQTGEDYAAGAVADGTALLNSMRTNLANWTAALATGDLSAEDLEFLVKSQIDDGKEVAMKQAGLAQIKIDTFKNNLIALVTSTLSKLIK